MNTTAEQDALATLAETFPGYHLWRSRDGGGNPASYCATRTRPLSREEVWAGLFRTLIAASPEELRSQLARQTGAER
jgi:hypothetical protein